MKRKYARQYDSCDDDRDEDESDESDELSHFTVSMVGPGDLDSDDDRMPPPSSEAVRAREIGIYLWIRQEARQFFDKNCCPLRAGVARGAWHACEHVKPFKSFRAMCDHIANRAGRTIQNAEVRVRREARAFLRV